MKKIIYKQISKWFLDGCSQYNSLAIRKACRSKEQAKAIFDKLAVPNAKGLLFYSPFCAFSFVKEHGFPVVIKPNISGFSRGAHFPINNYWHLFKASIFVKIWWPKSVIEQYLWGKNYRIVVIRGKVMSVIRRYPPFIIGDGKNDISTLIDEENRIRVEKKLLPEMHLIPKDYKIKKYLKAQNLNLSSVAEDKKQVYLYNKVALKPGGIVEIIDKTDIAPENQAMLFKILAHLDANILGIDVICEQGLSTDFTKQKCFFLELNSRPYLAMHNSPRYGEKEDLSSYYEQLDAQEIIDGRTF